MSEVGLVLARDLSQGGHPLPGTVSSSGPSSSAGSMDKIFILGRGEGLPGRFISLAVGLIPGAPPKKWFSLKTRGTGMAWRPAAGANA